MQNREIKFRYWCKDFLCDGQMSKGFTLQETTGKENWNSLIPMQFTGLLDKQGKEIYEGDIIKINKDWKNSLDITRKCCLVMFYNGGFMFGRSKYNAEFMNTYLWIVNNAPQSKGFYATMSCEKTLEKFSVNILKALKSKKLK